MTEHYDMLVIGSGPGGQRAAIQASKLGKRVAVVEKSDQLGGRPCGPGPSLPKPSAKQHSSSAGPRVQGSWRTSV